MSILFLDPYRTRKWGKIKQRLVDSFQLIRRALYARVGTFRYWAREHGAVNLQCKIKELWRTPNTHTNFFFNKYVNIWSIGCLRPPVGAGASRGTGSGSKKNLFSRKKKYPADIKFKFLTNWSQVYYSQKFEGKYIPVWSSRSHVLYVIE